jgi:phage-related protein
MSVISTLVVKLTADTGQYKAGLAGAEKTTKGFGSKLGKGVKAAQVGAAAGLAAITAEAVKATTVYKDYGGAVNKLTGLMNVSTEDASRLVGQWKRFGIDAGTGLTAVKFLSKNIVAAKEGNQAAIDSFAKLGISMDDLQNMSAAEVMMKARDAMSQMEDKTQRTATMLKLFGRSGTEMLGWVKQSPADIEALNKSLAKMGLVWGDKQLEDYKDLAKAQGEAKLAWLGFQITLAQTIVPALTQLSQSILPSFRDALMFLGPALKYVVGALVAFLAVSKTVSMARNVGAGFKAMSTAAKGAGLAVRGFALGFKNAQQALSQGATGAMKVGAKVRTLGDSFKSAGKGLATFASTAAGKVKALASSVAAGAKAAALWAANTVRATASLVAQKVALVASAVATKLAAAAQWLLNVAMSANPIGLIVAAIAAVVVAFVLLYKKCKWFREGVKAFLGGALAVAKAVFGGIAAAVKWVVGIIKRYWKPLVAVLGGPMGVALALVGGKWKKLGGVVRKALGGISKVAKAAWSFLTGAASKAWDATKTVVTAAAKFIWQAMLKYGQLWLRVYTVVGKALLAAAKWAWDAIKRAVTAVLGFLGSAISKAWNAYLATVRRVLGLILGVVKSVWNAIKGAVSSALSAIGGLVTKWWNAYVATVKRVGVLILGAAKAAWNAVKGAVSSILSALAGVVRTLAGKVLSALKAAWGAVASIASRLWGGIKGAVTRALNFYSAMVSAGKKLVQGLWAGIQSLSSWLWGKVKGFASSIFNAVKEGLGKLWPFSPSVAGVELGYYLGLGIEKGIKQGMPNVKGAVKRLASAMVVHPIAPPALQPAPAGAGAGPLTAPVRPLQAAVAPPPVQVRAKVEAPPSSGPSVRFDFRGAIFVDSSQAGVERLYRLAVKGAQADATRRERMVTE